MENSDEFWKVILEQLKPEVDTERFEAEVVTVATELLQEHPVRNSVASVDHPDLDDLRKATPLYSVFSNGDGALSSYSLFLSQFPVLHSYVKPGDLSRKKTWKPPSCPNQHVKTCLILIQN